MRFLTSFKHFNKLFCIRKQFNSITCTQKLESSSAASNNHENSKGEYIQFLNDWPEDEKKCFVDDMVIHTDFITEAEEQHFIEELEPYLKRMRYEFDHWDDAIHGFRETERKNWYPDNKAVINRIRDIAFSGEILPHIHVLDLADKGVIKPHVDSTRYCGTTISGISLLSNSVMRLVRVDERKYNQTNQQDDYRSIKPPKLSDEKTYNYYADVLLMRRSLYIMKNSARYNFTHEILGNENSFFKQEKIDKTRRISIICRNNP